MSTLTDLYCLFKKTNKKNPNKSNLFSFFLDGGVHTVRHVKLMYFLHEGGQRLQVAEVCTILNDIDLQFFT